MKHLILTGFLLFSFFGLAEDTGVTPEQKLRDYSISGDINRIFSYLRPDNLSQINCDRVDRGDNTSSLKRYIIRYCEDIESGVIKVKRKSPEPHRINKVFDFDDLYKKKKKKKPAVSDSNSGVDEDEQVLSGEGESDDCLTCEYRLAVAKGAMRSELCTYFPYLHNEATGECVEEINTLEKEEQEFLINRAERLSPDELLVVGLAKNSLEREVLESDPDSALAREIINRERLAQMTRMIGMPAMPFANF